MWPAATKWLAIGFPIIPKPINPSSAIIFLLPHQLGQ
jgi:hypothetical protein